ncbi:hypothetical protein [Nocardia abscessus]|nr:hypothetical protein [Nocardia abscessus]
MPPILFDFPRDQAIWLVIWGAFICATYLLGSFLGWAARRDNQERPE